MLEIPTEVSHNPPFRSIGLSPHYGHLLNHSAQLELLSVENQTGGGSRYYPKAILLYRQIQKAEASQEGLIALMNEATAS